MCNDWYDYTIFKGWAIGQGYTAGNSVKRVDKSLGYNRDNCIIKE